MCGWGRLWRSLLLLSCALSCAFVAAETSTAPADKDDFYELLGVPHGASVPEIKKAYHKLSLKWHPDKWYGEGGAFEGIDKADVLVDDAEEAKQHFYKLSRANEVLTDREQRRIYDESLGDGRDALARIRAEHGPSWGQGCQNAAYGCLGTNIAHARLQLLPSDVNTLGTFGSAAACLMACEAHPDCHAYAYHSTSFRAQGSDSAARPNAGKCEMRRWIQSEMLWNPVNEVHVTSGFCPGAGRKYQAEKYGRTSLLRLIIHTWQAISLLPGRLWKSMCNSPEGWGTLAAMIAGTWLVIQWRERRRIALYAALEQQRQDYRKAELARMREEIEHRELAAKLEKQLKRELYEAKKLEEERKAKELEANEVLLRERMQNKYSVLEERKREAREQARLLEEEKKRAKAETALRKSLPGLYRQVARETGEYTNNVGETQLAVPRRLGGAQAMVVREEVTSEVARVQTVRAAQERLDEAVMNGVLPDEDTLRVAEEARRAAQRQSQRSAEKLRLEKALPSIARTLGETLGQAEPSAPGTQAGEEGEASEGMEVAQRRVGPEAEETYGGGGFKQKPRAAALDPAGRYAAGAAAAAAERREQQLAESGVLDVELARVERERAEREWLEQEAERKVKESQRRSVAKAIPSIYNAVTTGAALGSIASQEQDGGGAEGSVPGGDTGTGEGAGVGKALVSKDPHGKYAAGAAAAAAERRFGMTAEQVVECEPVFGEVEAQVDDDEGMVVALRDAAGAVPDVLMRVRRPTLVSVVRAAAMRELLRRGVHSKTVSKLLFSGKFLKDDTSLVSQLDASMTAGAKKCDARPVVHMLLAVPRD